MNLYVSIMMLTVSLYLTGCDGKISSGKGGGKQEDIKKIVDSVTANMQSVKGGIFLMGDFGSQIDEKLPFSPNGDDKYLHQVALSDFKINKFKITYKDYDFYSESIGAGKIPGSSWLSFIPKIRDGNIPASVTWQQAKDYCLWLGKSSGKAIGLPTEAQWEYAARSEGKHFPYPTDNGNYEPGRNVANAEQIETIMGYSMSTYPVGKYPVNSLGLYDMGFNGREWVNDWYSAEYYQASQGVKDPTGPDTGEKKVMRGFTHGDFHTALTMYRQSEEPIPGGIDNYKNNGLTPFYTFRCVMNN